MPTRSTGLNRQEAGYQLSGVGAEHLLRRITVPLLDALIRRIGRLSS